MISVHYYWSNNMLLYIRNNMYSFSLIADDSNSWYDLPVGSSFDQCPKLMEIEE